MTKVAIGVITYNGAERLDWLLKSISMRTPMLATGDAKVILVDDGSPREPETRAVAQKWESQGLPLQYIPHGNNRGISAGWNTCSRATDAPIVALINDDVIVADGGWLESLVHVLEHSPKVGVVGQSWHAFLRDDVSQLLSSPDSERGVIARDPVSKQQVPDRRQQHEDTNPGRVMCPTGQLFAFRRVDFDTVGGFDERMQSFFEESSFGTEMASRGMIGCQIGWPFNWHLWSETFKTNPELNAGHRMEHSRNVYRERWQIPDSIERGREFDYTNPKFMQAIGDVEVGFLRKDGSAWRGILRRDGAFVDGCQVQP